MSLQMKYDSSPPESLAIGDRIQLGVDADFSLIIQTATCRRCEARVVRFKKSPSDVWIHEDYFTKGARMVRGSKSEHAGAPRRSTIESFGDEDEAE